MPEITYFILIWFVLELQSSAASGQLGRLRMGDIATDILTYERYPETTVDSMRYEAHRVLQSTR